MRSLYVPMDIGLRITVSRKLIRESFAVGETSTVRKSIMRHAL
jgi:hypothetical protein